MCKFVEVLGTLKFLHKFSIVLTFNPKINKIGVAITNFLHEDGYVGLVTTIKNVLDHFRIQITNSMGDLLHLYHISHNKEIVLQLLNGRVNFPKTLYVYSLPH